MLRRIRLCLAAILIAEIALAQSSTRQPLQKIVSNYPTRTGQVWPLYLAKEGGYYQKYGFDADLKFGIHPVGIAMIVSGEAVMTAYTLEQAMQASSKDGSLIAFGSPFKKSLFALMAQKKIGSIKDLKGKTIGVSQIGDAPYNYTVGLIGKAGLDSSRRRMDSGGRRRQRASRRASERPRGCNHVDRSGVFQIRRARLTRT